jgi:hypothetical protein
MKTNINTKHFGNDISVKFVYFLKGKAQAKTVFVRFYFSQKNIVLQESLISTSLKVKKEEWNGLRVVSKDGIANQKKNSRLMQIETTLDNELTKLSVQASVKLTNLRRFKLTSAGRCKLTTVGRSNLNA